jgi:hypothetical protein
VSTAGGAIEWAESMQRAIVGAALARAEDGPQAPDEAEGESRS